MREISAALITRSVARMCIEANCYLPEDVRARLEGSLRDEPWPIAQEILTHILQNAEMAAARPQPICQDTGMACVFVELGQDVHVDGDLAEAIHEGVRRGYTDGYLRKSVVRDPLDRVNTGDNTPAMIYYEIPCPPIVVGVGVGGTFDKAALLAKKALLRETGTHNENEMYAALEDELLEKINALGIGPQGFGGRTTALAVHIESMPTHIAGLPVAVNINCHVARHLTEVL